MGQRLLLSLPAVAAAIVAWAVLAGRGAPVRYAEVLGGPTGTLSSVLVRALQLERDGRVVPSPGLALRLLVEGGGARATLAGTTDAMGQLELRLHTEPPPAAPWLRVESQESSQVLAEGRPSLSPERWSETARRDGGWLPGRASGALRVRAAAEWGTFAVPFESALVVQVLEPAPDAGSDAPPGAPASADRERPIAGAALELELSGATPLASPAPLTAGDGLSRVALRPEEHAVSAHIVARAGERHGEWHGVLPVTPGALVAARAGDELRVRSPIPRERAFASIVTARARVAGAIVPLEARADGSASGSLALDAPLLERIEREPTWVVVSSEHDKRSAGVVGWPLSPAGFDPSAPPRTFAVADAVLLDGRAAAVAAVERERARRRRLAAGALLAVGLLMATSFWRAVGEDGTRVRAGVDVGVDAQGDPVIGAAPLAPRGWVLTLAFVCIALGLGGLAYFGLAR